MTRYNKFGPKGQPGGVEDVTPPRCAKCNKPVRPHRNDPCDCTRRYAVQGEDAEGLSPTAKVALEAAAEGRVECPACDGTKLDDNGERSTGTLSFCCTDCGEHFDCAALREVAP